MDRVLGRPVASWTGLAVACFIAAAGVGTAAEDAAPAEYLLRYKFRPDDTLRWKVVHRATVDATVNGVSQTTEAVTVSTKVWKVRKVDASGTATFEQFVDQVDMWQKTSGRMEVRYNSQTDKKPPVGFEGVAKSIGVPLSRTAIDAKGKILARQHLTARPQGEQEGMITIPLPEAAVAVGESWTTAFDIEIPVGAGRFKRIKAQQSYTLERVKNGVATIRMGTQILTPIDDPAIEAKLVLRQPSGSIRFDIEAGRIVAQQMDTDKRVIGFSGEASVLHYRTRFTEEALAAGTAADKSAELSAEEKKTGAAAPAAAKPAAGPAEETGAAAKPGADSAAKSASRPKPAESQSRK